VNSSEQDVCAWRLFRSIDILQPFSYSTSFEP
jgi:hypothetical protein